MAALAYLLPPLSGMIAFFGARSERVRTHGAQAVVLGALWPAATYAASLAGAGATRVAFAIGVLVWVALMVATALGLDPTLAWLKGRLTGGAYREE